MLLAGSLLTLLASPSWTQEKSTAPAAKKAAHAPAKKEPPPRTAVVVGLDLKTGTLRVREPKRDPAVLKPDAGWRLTAGCVPKKIRLADIRIGDRVRFTDRSLHVERRCRKRRLDEPPPADEAAPYVIDNDETYIEELDNWSGDDLDTTWSRPQAD